MKDKKFQFQINMKIFDNKNDYRIKEETFNFFVDNREEIEKYFTNLFEKFEQKNN